MRFFRFLNPIRAFNNLKADNAILATRAAHLTDANRFLRLQRDNVEKTLIAYDNGLHFMSDLAGSYEHAIDAFMVEREELQAEIALRDATGLLLSADLLKTLEIAALLDQEADDLDAEVRSQAAQIVEIVDYVKQVEARLGAAGITIADGEDGPEITVDQAAFVQAVRGGRPNFAAGTIALAA